MMDCPKCGERQSGTVECEKCGVIFAKYEAYLQRQQITAGKKGKSSTGNSAQLVQLLLVAVIVAGLTYYFTRPKTLETADSSVKTDSIRLPEVQDPRTNVPVIPDETGNKPELTDNNSFSTPIERARVATVSIETPWGTGSGFFVEKNHIVTNKHVVEFDINELDGIREKLQTNRKLIELEEEKLAELRRKLRDLPAGPSKKQLAILLQEREKELKKYKLQQEKGEQRLAELEQNSINAEITIILSDGEEHSAGYLVVSPNYDLALLALYSYDGVSLERPPGGQKMRQGDKVYTVGSPVGLRHTVTAGVFSGYRKRERDDQLFLQTDAAINPGNSGGPLIDEDGYVHGVNTLILRNTEGIGFAIPIERVFEEFSTTLN